VQSAHWWWQVGLSVGVVTGRANLILVGEFLGGDVDTDAHVAVVFHLIGALLLVVDFLAHLQPEAVSVFLELERLILGLLHIVLVVLLVDLNWSLSKLSIFEGLFQIDGSRTDDIVSLEEVTIVSLQGVSVVLSWEHHLVVETVVEAGLTGLTSVVSISLEWVLLGVEETSDVNI